MEQTAAIGKVINTHGVKGGLKVQPLSDFPERVKKLTRVFVEKDNASTPYKVADGFVNGRFWVVHLEGVNDMSAARRLVGALLTIPLSERMTLRKDEFYLDQILGLAVYTADGALLGRVRDILQTGSNDVYVVRGDGEGARDVLIPALKAIVQNIDLDNGRLEVDLPEGLL